MAVGEIRYDFAATAGVFAEGFVPEDCTAIALRAYQVFACGTYHVCEREDGGEILKEGVVVVCGDGGTYRIEADVEGGGFVVFALRCGCSSFGGVDVGGLKFGAGGLEIYVFLCHIVVDDAAAVTAGEAGTGVVLRIDDEAAQAAVGMPRAEGLVFVAAALEGLPAVADDCEDVDGFYAVGWGGHGCGDDDDEGIRTKSPKFVGWWRLATIALGWIVTGQSLKRWKFRSISCSVQRWNAVIMPTSWRVVMVAWSWMMRRKKVRHMPLSRR